MPTVAARTLIGPSLSFRVRAHCFSCRAPVGVIATRLPVLNDVVMFAARYRASRRLANRQLPAYACIGTFATFSFSSTRLTLALILFLPPIITERAPPPQARPRLMLMLRRPDRRPEQARDRFTRLWGIQVPCGRRGCLRAGRLRLGAVHGTSQLRLTHSVSQLGDIANSSCVNGSVQFDTKRTMSAEDRVEW